MSTASNTRAKELEKLFGEEALVRVANKRYVLTMDDLTEEQVIEYSKVSHTTSSMREQP